jgi:membrane associated rhomboid family serine protease
LSIEDRDYWREEPRTRWSFAGAAPKWFLVGGTCLAFLVQQAIENGDPLNGGRFLYSTFALSLDGVRSGRWWQPLSYALLHDGVTHLLWNMVALWCFASVLESQLPRARVLGLYAVGAAGGAAGYLAWGLAGGIGSGVPAVGASGAVTTLLAYAALRAPSTRVYVFFLEVPLWLLGTLFIAKDLLEFVTRTAGNVAVQAHLGGAAAGAVAWYLGRTSRRRPSGAPRAASCPECGKRLPAPGEGCPACGFDSADRLPPSPRVPGPADSAESARVDALLERIHARGIGALSDEERRFLNRVSQRYRGKRR